MAREVLDQTRQNTRSDGYRAVVKKVFGMMERLVTPVTDEEVSSGDGRQHLGKVFTACRRSNELGNAPITDDASCGIEDLAASIRIIHRDAEDFAKRKACGNIEGCRTAFDYSVHI